MADNLPKEPPINLLSYPAVFMSYEDGIGYVVTFPDLPGCTTGGDTLSAAINMAKDAAAGWVLTELEAGNAAPPASRLEDVAVPERGFVRLLDLNMGAYAELFWKNSSDIH